MPLRDHFRPPISKRWSWEGFHGIWPAAMVAALADQLPPQFIAEPRVHLGSFYEIDVSPFGDTAVTTPDLSESSVDPLSEQSPATAVYTAPAPTLCIEAEIPEQYAYEVLVFDTERERTLVAAVEMVSPANKDRPESRQLFVTKCANLLRRNVCVSIVDAISIRRFNLCSDLLALVGYSDPAVGYKPAPTYAATCRQVGVKGRGRIETWSYELKVGQTLPSLPMWLSEGTAVSLDLETSYENACRMLRIP